MNKSPILPTPPHAYSSGYMNQLLLTLRLYFDRLESPARISAASININLRTLPTEADLAQLRPGDVYRDTTADNTLKVKP